MLFLLSSFSHALPLSEYIDIQGYLEARTTYGNTTGTRWQSVERLRPTVRIHPHPNLTLHTTFNASLTQGRYVTGEFINLVEQPLLSALPASFDGAKPSLDELIEECNWDLQRERTIDEVSDVLQLARLYADIHTKHADLRLGRQAINWGSALFFNPTDVLAQNLFAEPWQERQGIQAARLNIPLGEDGMLTSVLTIDDQWEQWKGGLRAGSNWGATDIYGVSYTNGDEYLLGFDVKGDLHVGWWLEGGYFAHLNEPFSEGHSEISAGIDYSFPVLERLTIAAQVTHDQSGEIPELYDWNARQDPELFIPPCPSIGLDLPEPPEEFRTSLGRWYGLTTQRLLIDQNWSFSNLMLINLADQTGIVFPSVAFAGELLTLNAGAQLIIGSDGEFNPPLSRTQQLGVDFRDLYPGWTILTWTRWNY